jgi:hypothetical protein
VWNSTLATCACPFNYVTNTIAKTCTSCSIVDSVLVSDICVNCTKISNANGPSTGNTACNCIAPLQWYWNTTSLAGSCICNSSY